MSAKVVGESAGSAQTEKEQAEEHSSGGLSSIDFNDPVTFTPSPKKIEWRIGYSVGNDYFLEIPPDYGELETEARKLKDEVREFLTLPQWQDLHHGNFILVPFSKATKLKSVPFVNPQKWTVINMQGVVRELSFPHLATYVNSGVAQGYYLASTERQPKYPYIKRADIPNDDDLILGLAGAVTHTAVVRRSVSKMVEVKSDTLLEDSVTVPASFHDLISLSAFRKAAGKIRSDGNQIKIDCNSIEADIGNGEETLWVVNYSNYELNAFDDLPVRAILRKRDGSLQTLSVVGPVDYGDAHVGLHALYRARFVAAVDLDGDKVDELIVAGGHYEGSDYHILKLLGGELVDVYESFYIGQ